ncbi:hypothetical protein DPV93_03195 [Haemophilus sputorum]|uniref:Secreted protein n=1 Tax=Haemophilus sputorum TaxID=1078480 RepID=A0A369YJA4_9PAST|nr:hypothetical protein [Haemophilus sputorum]RDE73107.1 hypothetical protein DPV93_03195 [Haemophilus sputorum]
MKKIMAISAIVAFTVAGFAEARGGRSGGFGGSSPRAVVSKPVQTQKTQSTQQKQDATFENTPNRTIPNQPQQAVNGNRMANFATGAAAGYLLSNALAPNEAVAQEGTTQAQTVTETKQAPATQNVVSTVAQFHSIGGQIDPYLVEKTDGYRRYCIGGVQYLAAAQGGQSTPIVMVNPNGTPLECQLLP